MDPCPACGAAGIVPECSSPTTTTTTARATNDTASSTCRSAHSSLPPLRIAVIGGGIGGLAVAVALQHRGFEVVVYERDAHYHQRRQGYGLTMQQAAKQLKALGISESALLSSAKGIRSTKHVVHTADGTVVGQWGMRHWMPTSADTNGEGEPRSSSITQKNKSNKRQNIHIARQALRFELLERATSMNPNVVQWNHRFMDYRVDEATGDIVCRFQIADSCSTKEDLPQKCGPTTEQITAETTTRILETPVDILVGADGIRSQVREQLLQPTLDRLRYLGCIVILGICPLTALSSSISSSPLLRETVFQTADGTTRIYMMPFSASSSSRTQEYMWQLSFPTTELAAQQLSLDGPQALQAAAHKRCHTWHSPVPEILQATPTQLISGYPVYDRAVLKSLPKGRITLLGDAAHPMSPFKGQGANQALLDALSLARWLYKVSGVDVRQRFSSVEDNLQHYASEMIERTTLKVQASAEAAQILHSEVAIHKGNVTRGGALRCSDIKVPIPDS